MASIVEDKGSTYSPPPDAPLPPAPQQPVDLSDILRSSTENDQSREIITLAGSAMGKRAGGAGLGDDPPSPVQSSPPPSPLALSMSDCSSPPPALGGQGDVEHNPFFSASVLTHEGCDPMLSASPSGPGGGGGAAGIGIGDEGGVFPGSSAAAGRSSSSSSALQPFSPPELAAATAFFGNTTTSSSSAPSGTEMSSSSNKLLRLSTASSDSQHSMSASAQGYDLVAANASRISEDGSSEDASSPFPASTVHAEQPRKDQITLLGCHVITLNVPKEESKVYVAHVFDRGTYFSCGLDADPDLLAHLRSPGGTTLAVLYSKLDPNRASFDHVSVKFNSTESSHRWTTLPKPGTAMQAIQAVREARPFFLQATAASKIDGFFSSCFGASWVLASKMIVDVSGAQAAEAASSNADLAHFESKRETGSAVPPIGGASKVDGAFNNNNNSRAMAPRNKGISSVVGSPPPPDYQTALSSSDRSRASASQTLHLSSGTITLHADLISGQQQQKQQQQQLSLSKFASTQIPGRQYECLTQEQAEKCTSCTVCNKRFKYVMEHLLHFTMGSRCRNFVLSSSSSSSSKSSSAKQSFFSLLAEVMLRKCGLDSDAPRLICDRCLSVMSGPIEYAMHRDMHRPAMGDLYPCQFCGLLFRTPHGFYRHPCIKHWNVAETLRVAAEKKKEAASAAAASESSGGSTNEDAFKVYSQLTEEERRRLTQCPVCQKQSAYMSGFVSHLRSSPPCLSSVVAAHRSAPTASEVLNLPRLALSLPPSPQQQQQQPSVLAPRPITCEECGVRCANQAAYAAHKDHHSLRRQGMLICKGCDCEYKAPCEFYRHSCNGGSPGSGAKLHWCPFCDVCRRFDSPQVEDKSGGDKVEGDGKVTEAFSPVPVVAGGGDEGAGGSEAKDGGGSTEGEAGKKDMALRSVFARRKSESGPKSSATTPPKRPRGRMKTKNQQQQAQQQQRQQKQQKVSPAPSSKSKTNQTARKSTTPRPKSKIKGRLKRVPLWGEGEGGGETSIYVCRGCSPRKLLRGSREAARHRCVLPLSVALAASPLPERKAATAASAAAAAGMPERLSRFNRFRLAVPDAGLAEDDGLSAAAAGGNGAARIREELERIRRRREKREKGWTEGRATRGRRS